MPIVLKFFCAFMIMLSCKASVFGQSNPAIAAGQFAKEIQQKNIQLLDVRTAGEYREGHIKNALQADWTNQQEFIERAKALDKSKPVYIYCLSGGRSGAAATYLADQGYKVYNLSGGMGAWKSNNLPVEKDIVILQTSLKQYLQMLPKDKSVLVDFGAAWCPPCKKMNPIIDSLESTNMTVIRFDGGQQTDLVKQLGIQALPTFIVYKNKKETWRKTGIVAAAEIASRMR